MQVYSREGPSGAGGERSSAARSPYFYCCSEIGKQPASWYSTESGLFSDRPHICLTENFWDAEQNVATVRYFIVDGSTGDVTRYAGCTQAYTHKQYRALLEECGFGNVIFHPSLSGGHRRVTDGFYSYRLPEAGSGIMPGSNYPGNQEES